MSRSTQAGQSSARQPLATEIVGRQLRAAFDPVPTGADEFADLLAQLAAAETVCEPEPAE